MFTELISGFQWLIYISSNVFWLADDLVSPGNFLVFFFFILPFSGITQHCSSCPNVQMLAVKLSEFNIVCNNHPPPFIIFSSKWLEAAMSVLAVFL